MTVLTFRLDETTKPLEVEKPPSCLARQLALAYHVEKLVDDRTLESYADAARRLGITRARMSQIVRLLSLLPIAAQENILLQHDVPSERKIRSLARDGTGQVALSGGLRSGDAVR